jgi:PIN domain nuclease of toxin-antitoxin system
LSSRFLLDTHIVARWLTDSKKLTREQARVLGEAARHSEQLNFSAITLLEIAALENTGKLRGSVRDMLASLEFHPQLRVIPVSFQIATEVIAIGDSLRDPFDRAIVATARVHTLTLITSDGRIVNSKLVPVVE